MQRNDFPSPPYGYNNGHSNSDDHSGAGGQPSYAVADYGAEEISMGMGMGMGTGMGTGMGFVIDRTGIEVTRPLY